MSGVAIICSSVDGHTRTICERIKQVIEQKSISASLIELAPGTNVSIDDFDTVLIGASIRYGKHRPEVAQFILDNSAALSARKSAFFSVNAVARKADKNEAHSNPYVVKFFANLDWAPDLVAVFGGRICYAKYGFLDRTMIRFIMWMTDGPTNLDADVDFTDWGKVDALAESLCAPKWKK